jgi:hypothetical protein
MTALSTLTTVSPAGPVLGALRPIVAPLARLLSELGDDIDAAERSPSQGPGDPNP